MTGVLVNGIVVPVPGVTVIGPGSAPWAQASPEDGRSRNRWPQQLILHKTLADDPEVVRPGIGPLGHPERTARAWADAGTQSGAPLVVGGEAIACLADVVRWKGWHANQANDRSVGIEHCEERGGIVYQAVLDNGVALVRVLVAALGIQLQVPRGYAGRPLTRFRDGGSTLVGVFGHRDVTDRRGRWDPGDELFRLLIQRLGAEAFDFESGEDLAAWKDRQRWLNRRGERLVVDGIPGPATTAALRRAGYRDGIWAFGPWAENPAG
jgi:hypothetical protein